MSGNLTAAFYTHDELMAFLKEEGPFSQYQVTFMEGNEYEPPLWQLHVPSVLIIEEVFEDET